MNLPSLPTVPYVGCAQVDCEWCSIVVTLPEGGTEIDLTISEATRAGRRLAVASMTRTKAAQLRDWLTKAIDLIP